MKIESNYCVYIHRNIINNKAYIGITKYGNNPNKRWRDGDGYLAKNKENKYIQTRFANAIQKYGWDNFEHIIWADNLTEDNAKEIEIMLIALFDTTNQNYGYNISPGGNCPSVDDVAATKRVINCVETKNQNRIQKSIIMFKDRFDNGDENILQCQKCGAYFEKEQKELKTIKDPSKSKRGRIKRKYCDYCAKYHKSIDKIIVCIDCGKEFVVKSNNTKTCRCETCQEIYRKNYKKDYMRDKRKNEISKVELSKI